MKLTIEKSEWNWFSHEKLELEVFEVLVYKDSIDGVKEVAYSAPYTEYYSKTNNFNAQNRKGKEKEEQRSRQSDTFQTLLCLLTHSDRTPT